MQFACSLLSNWGKSAQVSMFTWCISYTQWWSDSADRFKPVFSLLCLVCRSSSAVLRLWLFELLRWHSLCFPRSSKDQRLFVNSYQRTGRYCSPLTCARDSTRRETNTFLHNTCSCNAKLVLIDQLTQSLITVCIGKCVYCGRKQFRRSLGRHVTRHSRVRARCLRLNAMIIIDRRLCTWKTSAVRDEEIIKD